MHFKNISKLCMFMSSPKNQTLETPLFVGVNFGYNNGLGVARSRFSRT